MSFVGGNSQRPRTLVEAFRTLVRAVPDRVLFTWLADGEQDVKTLRFDELDRTARAGAATLQAMGAAGERVILLITPGLDFVRCYLACLYAGAIAVPVIVSRRKTHFEQMKAIASHSEARFVLADDDLPETPLGPFQQQNGVRWLSVGQALAGDADAASEFSPRPEDVAFLQYTSGSTGRPRGAVITHANLIHNSDGIRWVRGDNPGVGVNWLPPYHDMGLIGTIVHAFHTGDHSVLMSPQHFLQRPARWLAAITRYRATISAAPDFALRLCTERISDADCASLDLSSWRLLICGAEPVRAATWEAFSSRFAPFGLDPNILSPCYGLAESTLIVTGQRWNEKTVLREIRDTDAQARTGGRMGTQGRAIRQVLGTGRAIPGQKVLIVDQDLNSVPAGTIGEILVSGASVAQGYYKEPVLSQQTFGVRVSSSDDRWLRTGDLGFQEDGLLFIAGRVKDMIKIRGRVLYPQDVEDVAGAAHLAIGLDGVAAFGIDNGDEEQLVIVLEVKRAQRHTPLEEIAAAVRDAVAREHGIVASAITLLAPVGLPRTSSGKLQRGECRRRWLEGTLPLFVTPERELSP